MTEAASPTLADVAALDRLLGDCLQSDRHRFWRELRSLRGLIERGQPADKKLNRLRDQIEKSRQTVEHRRENRPPVTFDEALPVSGRREEIAAAIRSRQVVVLCGETGSGKSTQLPKICLEAGRGIHGLIGHTQPRRIAARSVATRVAEELGSPLGSHVGYKVRFTDATSESTYIKLMTDGILLAELQTDRFLDRYDTIIIDEAHERSLNIDFLLGQLKRLLPKRPDLRVIITSATLDAARFAEHFADSAGPAPVIEVAGRTYPVDVIYKPLDEASEDGDGPQDLRAIVEAVEDIARLDSGDILVFMPTERDIHELAKLIRSRRLHGDSAGLQTEVLPLYARLSAADQQRVFKTSQWRRIVISTNVAESSLTVPGIRFVVDPGTVRLSRYSPRTQMQRLPIEPISRASADQRKGRCGRVGPGICVRLYSEEDYNGRPQYTPPEIQRTNLASVILQALTMNLGAIEEFPFLEPPRTDAIRDGYKTLFELGAIDENNALTDRGRQMGRLPVDPRIARMILAADEEGCLSEMLIIASALEVQDPRERPLEKQQAADEAHQKFQHEDSDFLTYVKLWDFYHNLKGELSRNQLQKACKQNFLSYMRMREWGDVHAQLRQMVEQSGLRPQPRRDDGASIHRALLAGLLTNIAQKSETAEYTVAGGTKAFLWPGSAIHEKKPQWVVAAELIETSRRYIRCAGRINPNWIEPLAGHLVKLHHSEPLWNRETGLVEANERVTLAGLTIVPRRRVRFGPLNPALARTLFIQFALVEGDFDSQFEFFKHNQALLEEIETTQAKARRRDLLLGERARYEFYDRRLPYDVYDTPTLKRWLRSVEPKNPEILFMKREDLVRDEDERVTPTNYPETLTAGSIQLPLAYNHDPGGKDDGLTITVPKEGVSQIDPQMLGWLVPGLLEEKITALIKTLPKPIRRHFVPAPQTARRVVGLLEFGKGSLVKQLAETLSKLSHSIIPADAFEPDRLPDHLRMNVRVVNAEGETVTESRDLVAVRQKLGLSDASPAASSGKTKTAHPSSVTVEIQTDDPQWQRDEITSWDFGDLPQNVNIERGGGTIQGYPAIIDRGTSISLRLYADPVLAKQATRNGLRRLFLLSKAKRELKAQRDHLPDWTRMKLEITSLPAAADVPEQILELFADLAMPDRQSNDARLPTTEAAFQTWVRRTTAGIGPAVQIATPVLGPLFHEYHQTRLALETSPGRNPQSQWHDAVKDMLEQLAYLVVPGFLIDTPWDWLRHYPRYFRAQRARLDKIAAGVLARDRELFQELRPRWEMYKKRRQTLRAAGVRDPELELYRWMIEEWRVSLFAQTLGTSMPISARRVDRQWQKVRMD